MAEKNIEHPEAAKANLRQIIKGANRATELVQQILTFSREQKHKKQILRVDLLINEVIDLLLPTIPEVITIKANISSRSTILADPTQIHQVAMNLCTNALQAMSDFGGTLIVTLKDIEITDKTRSETDEIKLGKHVRLEVSDTGKGMDQNTLEKIFEPYFTTKEVGEGTGLGLAVVYGIVEEHNGIIKAYSAENAGSTFHVYFPTVA